MSTDAKDGEPQAAGDERMNAPTAAQLTFNEITVGDCYQIERRFTVDDVQRFASLSGDFSPLHVNEVYASATEFGGCVVHGMLLASLFSQLVGMKIPGQHALYVGQDLSFRHTVRVGEKVTALAKVVGKVNATRVIVLNTEIRNSQNRVVVSGSAKVKLRDSEPVSLPQNRMEEPYAVQRGRQVAVVTGASRGLGADIARLLASRGISVAVNYLRNSAKAREVVRDICQLGGTAVAVQADVRNAEDVRRMFDIASQQLGEVDLLINSAGPELHHQPAAETPWNVFQEQLDHQVKGVLQTCQAAYPRMKAAGGGAIVNVLSQAVSGQPPANMADYVTGKYALYGLSKALAAEWARDNIRVNMVSPGLVQTDLTQHYPDRLFKMEADRTPLRRLAQVQDVANCVAFLLSQEAAFLTGVNLFVTGGQVMA